MKTSFQILPVAVSLGLVALTQSSAAPAEPEPQIVERVPHQQGPDTKTQFRLFPEGAVAEEGLFRLIVAPDLADEPTVDLQMPDGKRLQISPRWLAFFDHFTGQSAMIAAVKPCAAELVAPNVAVFMDSMDEAQVALRITYQSSGVDREVILLESDPFSREAATAAGFSPDSPGLVLEMWSEILAWPEVVSLSTNALENGLPDVHVSFGETHLAAGKAFSLGDEGDSIPVAQSWTQVGQNQFLIETVRYADVAPLLARLPEHAQALPGVRPALNPLVPGVAIRTRTLGSYGLALGKVADASVSSGEPADTDGDGVNDDLEVLLGRNPLVAGTTNDVNNVVSLRLYTPLK
jgi:hypothetical protein